jgi:uncharacterized membrane protein YoaK (UPF0700 family)
MSPPRLRRSAANEIAWTVRFCVGVITAALLGYVFGEWNNVLFILFIVLFPFAMALAESMYEEHKRLQDQKGRKQ